MSQFEVQTVLLHRISRLLSAGRITAFIFFLIVSLPAVAEAAPRPSPAPTSYADRLRLQREILDLKIRAARDPASVSSVRKRLARVYLDSGEPEKAIALYRQAIIFDRSQASSYHRTISRIYRGLGREEEAEEELRRAEAVAPDREADRRRRQLAAWEAEGKEDLLLQQFRFLYWTGIGSGDQYLKNIARLLFRRGEKEEARRYYRLLIADYRRRIEENPDRAVNYHLRIARLFSEMEDEPAAAEEYRRAVAAEGEKGGRALIGEAGYYRSRGELGRAIALYREARGRPGVDPAALRIKIASLLERRGEEEKALAELRSADDLEEEERGKIAIMIARHFERRGELAAALEEYRGSLEYLGPLERARTWERIGDLLRRLDRGGEAAPAYREALRRREENLGGEAPSAVYLESAVDLARKGGLEEEEEDYTRRLIAAYRLLLEREPGRAAYYHRKLGDALRVRGDYAAAAAHYRTWSGLAPGDPAPHFRLYRLYRDHLDNPRGAENHRERYRELREPDPGSG